MTSVVDGPPPISSGGGDGPSLHLDAQRKNRKDHAATGASAAGVRALSSQLVAFYFRAPIKAFFRTRVDYMAYARAINPRVQANEAWSFHTSTFGLLGHAVKTHGWSFIPNQVLPPLMANVSIGAILYTSYLQTLGFLYEPASRSTKRVYPPPSVRNTFTAGFVAGSIQSLVAAPLDALSVRFHTSDMLEGQYKNMWQYARVKLQEIGARGIFAGYSLSLLKDSLGYGVFFATFEYTKSQLYHSFLRKHYGKDYTPYITTPAPAADQPGNPVPNAPPPIIKPHYMLEPAFIAMAGLFASLTQQTLQYPLSRVQDLHYSRLESLDYTLRLAHQDRKGAWHIYMNAYKSTLEQASIQARLAGGWWRWSYCGFVNGVLRNAPSSAAGLIMFEIVRRRYGGFGEEEEPQVVEGGNGVRIWLN